MNAPPCHGEPYSTVAHGLVVSSMVNEIPITSSYLVKGAVFAFEQCGTLLQAANCLYRNGSYASAVVLAAFAREGWGEPGYCWT